MPSHFSELGLIILLASLAAVALGRFKQQPMIGYVIAGIIIGPSALGLIDNEKDIAFIAELGVILLLFVLGMGLPLKSFKDSYKVSVPATFLLTAFSVGITFVIGFVIDLSFAEKLVYGFIISLSSTAVAVKLLDELDLLDKGPGQIAVSILIVQDLLFVPMIMLVGVLGVNGDFDIWFLPKLLAAVGLLIGLIAYLSHKEKVHLLFHTIVERYDDLIPVAALSWCFVGAGLSEFAGLSPAYGAFLAGLVIGNSHSKHVVIPKIEPMQSVLIMVFFLSIGMLLDFQVIADNWVLVGMLLLGAMVFKTVSCITLLHFFMPAEHWRRSFVAGLTISQIGEFSFILASAALAGEIFDNESYKIIIAVIALSLVFSPLWSSVLQRFVQVAYRHKTADTLGEAAIQSLQTSKKK